MEQETSTASRDLKQDAAVSNKAETQREDDQFHEEDMDAQTETESTQASAVEKGSNDIEGTVDSESGSKAENAKTEESAAEATALKESSSVEGDDQKKRFVVLCLLEKKKQAKWLCLLHWFLLLTRFFGALGRCSGLRIPSQAVIFVVTLLLYPSPSLPSLSNALQVSLAAPKPVWRLLKSTCLSVIVNSTQVSSFSFTVMSLSAQGGYELAG